MPTADVETNRFADLVHRLGEQAAAKVQSKILGREALLAKTEQEHAAALAQLQSERDAAFAAQDRLNSFQLEVDRAADELILAKSTLAAFQVQLASLEATRLNGWGDPAVIEKFGGPHYLDIADLRTAIADWPRVQAHLAKKLERAEKALAEFERTL